MGLRKQYLSACLLTAVGILCIPLQVLAITTVVPVELEVPDTTLRVHGYASPGALVSILDGNSEVASVVAASNGQFSTLLTAQSPGLHQISLRFTDDRGNRSLLLKKPVSLQPQTENQLDVFLPPTLIRESPATLSSGSLLKLSGYSVSYGVVSLYLDGSKSGITARAGSNGYYEALIDTTPMRPGSHYFSATASISGETSPLSSLVSFSLLPIGRPPTVPDIIVLPTLLPAPYITSPKNGFTSNKDVVDISGTAVPGSQITVYGNGIIIGSVLAGLNGQWTYRYYASESITVAFSADACNSGNCSLPSNTVKVTFRLKNLCNLNLALKTYRFDSVAAHDPLTLQLVYRQRDVTIRVYWGDGTNLTAEHYPKADSTNFYKTYENPGTYQGLVTMTGSSCSQSVNFTARVFEPNAEPKASHKIKSLVAASTLAAAGLAAVQAVRLYRLRKPR